jgi:DNA-binding transcriptional LysR family regulator
MNIDHAKYFIILSETQHIQKAARLLGISSTAISHGVSKLEEELNVQLTAKVGRNIILTEKGIEFARQIRPLLEQIEKVKEGLSGESLTTGLYKIAVTHSLFSFIQNKKTFKMIQSKPEITLEIQAKRSAEVISSVADGSIDFGMCFSPLEHPTIKRKILYKGKLVFCASNSHPITKIKSITERVLLLNKFDAVGTKAFQGIENCESHPEFVKLKIQPSYKYIVDSYDLKLPILKQSQAWAFLPDIFLKNNSWLKQIEIGEYTAPYTVEAIWNKNRSPLRFYQLLLDDIEKHFIEIMS